MLLAGFTAVGTLAFLGSVITEKGLFSSEAASWFQAVGTVSAVGASVWAGTIALRAEDRRQRHQHEMILGMMPQAIWTATNMLEKLCTAVEEGDREAVLAGLAKWRAGEMTIMFDEMLALPITAWRSPNTYTRILRYRRAINEFVTAAESAVPRWQRSPSARESARAALLRMKETRQWLVEILAAYGVPV